MLSIIRRTATFALVIATALTSSAAAESRSPWPMLQPGPHSVGYRTIDVAAPSRTTGYLRSWDGVARPDDNTRRVRVSIWYPTSDQGDRPTMTYGDYIDAAGFETRIDSDLLLGTAAWIGHSSFGGADPTKLGERLGEPTTAYRDVAPLAGQHPAVVYAPSYSYEPFENTAMFEILASHGYVIASSRSSGPETLEMSYDQAGIEASVRDLELLVDVLHDFGHADLRRLGAAGFSWGGLSAAMFAMRHHNVAAVLALDGSLEHDELSSVRERWDWNPRALRGGYLAIVGDREPADSLAADALYADIFEVRYPKLEHWDFASDFIRIGVWSAGEPDPSRRRFTDDAYGILVMQARLLFDAYLKSDDAAREVLLEGSLRARDESIEIQHLTTRPAFPAPPSARELAEILRDDVAKARQVIERAKKNDPELELLDWMSLQDIVTTSPFDTKLELLALAREELGESSIYYNNLGQAWKLEGNAERAIGYFRKALEHNPDSGFAKRSIEELEAGG